MWLRGSERVGSAGAVREGSHGWQESKAGRTGLWAVLMRPEWWTEIVMG